MKQSMETGTAGFKPSTSPRRTGLALVVIGVLLAAIAAVILAGALGVGMPRETLPAPIDLHSGAARPERNAGTIAFSTLTLVTGLVIVTNGGWLAAYGHYNVRLRQLLLGAFVALLGGLLVAAMVIVGVIETPF